MIRRALLVAAVAATAAVLPAPAAQADEICILTVKLTGGITQTLHVVPCMDYDHGQLCEDTGAGAAGQTFRVDVCVPSPLAIPGG